MAEDEDNVCIDVQLEKSKYTPSEFLHGEVRVTVPAKYTDGYPFHRVRLCLYGKEKHVVRDDQAEFDALLAAYTSSRVYLSRHVTLAGPPRKSEAMEVEAQVKQEFLYKEHRATPYARVTPEKSIEDANKCSSDDEDYDSDEDVPETAAQVQQQLNENRAETAEEARQPISELPPVIDVHAVDIQVNRPDVPEVSGEEVQRRLRREPRRLMPGHHAYPFAFRLPPWLPPSLYYSTYGAAGSIRYWAEAQLVPPPPHQFRNIGPLPTKKLTTRSVFYVLSALPKQQLLRCYTEANIMLYGSDSLRRRLKNVSSSTSGSASLQHPEHGVSVLPPNFQKETVTALPPLSARYQLFACGFLGNMCCYDRGGAIEVEVQVRSSRALLLDDEEGINKNVAESLFSAPVSHDFLYGGGGGGDDNSPTDLQGGFVLGDVGKGMQSMESSLRNELPLPVGIIPLQVKVRNEHATKCIPAVRVELVENISIFKPLQAPTRFREPLARYDYTVSVPPSADITFDCTLNLPNAFCKQHGGKTIKHPHAVAANSGVSTSGNAGMHDLDAMSSAETTNQGKNYTHFKYLPPPGVSTVNITTALNIVISFPGLNTYVEEEDWFYHTLQVAESVDPTDEVLELPIKYS